MKTVKCRYCSFYALFKTVTKKQRSNYIEYCKLTCIWNTYQLLVTVKMNATSLTMALWKTPDSSTEARQAPDSLMMSAVGT